MNEYLATIDKLNELIEKAPQNPIHYLAKAEILLKNGIKKEAIDNYLKTASLCIKRGFFRKALAVYRMIIRVDPTNHEANAYLKTLMSDYKPSKSMEIPQNDFFSVFTDEEIADILQAALLRSYSDGEFLIKEDEKGDSLFVIIDGNVKIVATILGKRTEIARLKKGDMIGEMAFITGRERTASVIADGLVKVYELNHEDLKRFLEGIPEARDFLNEIYSIRVKDTLMQIIEGVKDYK